MSATAAPAAWWLWRSNLDGQTHCAQTSPGSGWHKASGPFASARCEPERDPAQPRRSLPRS